jgi:serine/threonine protein kinase
VGKGAHGEVFRVPLFPPLWIDGKRFTQTVVKAAIKATTPREMNTEIQASSRFPSLFPLHTCSHYSRFPLPDLLSGGRAPVLLCPAQLPPDHGHSNGPADSMLTRVLARACCLFVEQGLAALEHRNVVRFLGYSYGNWPNDSSEKTNMLLLSYCETDLKKMIYGKDQKLHSDYTKELMVKLIREIIAGLCYCHSKDVCHLDFKPENCLLAKDDSGEWTAKIADFGAQVGDMMPTTRERRRRLAREIGAEQAAKLREAEAGSADAPFSSAGPSSRTAAAERRQSQRQANQHGNSSRKNGWLGTYLWMSPEATGLNVERGYEKGRVCARASDASEGVDGVKDSIFGASDWFSFGIVVWEMWTKQLPHNGMGLAFSEEMIEQVWVNETGEEDRSLKPGDYTAQARSTMKKHPLTNSAGQWTEDLRAIAKAYYNGNRPAIPADCPVLLSKLMAACWQDRQQDRPKSFFMQRLAYQDDRGMSEEPVIARWLAPPELPYDAFLRKVRLADRKEELADYLGKDTELTELAQMDEDDLSSDILDDVDLDFDEDTKERFRAAVSELKGHQESTSTANQPGAVGALDAAAFGPLEPSDLGSTMTLSSEAERLADMEVSALRTEARAQVGVSLDAIEIASGEENAKAALIALILNRHTVYRWKHESGAWNTYWLEVQTRLQAAHREGAGNITWEASDGSTVHTYEIDLRSMVQKNVDSGTERRLQRYEPWNHRLHEAISAAKIGDWKQLKVCIFSTSNGAERLPNALINTVPHPRTYGILHQIAHFGATAVYMDLKSKGVSFDLNRRNRNGETAMEVADKQNMGDFVRMLAREARMLA